MLTASRRIQGFTVIELMVTVAVTVVLMMIAIPSFQTFRQRAALRSTADAALVLWNQARFEAAKRNTYVKFSRQSSGSFYCLGAATTTNPADSTACDCTTATPSDATLTCNVARYPQDQQELRGVSIGPSTSSSLGVVVIEPKRTFLTSTSTPGSIAFTGPSGSKAYKLYMRVDGFGRAVLCEPNTVTSHLSDYSTRQCTP